MATYTSTQNGNWNNPATWGGGGWPQNAGDVANIGHTVAYNVSSTVEMGLITINSGGLLDFSRSMNTKLTLGHVDIQVNNGGELRVGTLGAIIPKTYLAELIWNPTADSAKGINIASGGIVNVYGDPDYFGSDFDTTLISQAVIPAAPNAVTITVAGDFTTKWLAGQELLVHKGGTYANYVNDFCRLAITSVAANGANTAVACTVTERPATLTCLVGADVLNVSRNVRLYKLGYNSNLGQFNTLRPRVNSANVAGVNNVNINDAMFGGWERFTGNYSTNNFNGVWRNGGLSLYQFANSVISGIVMSNSSGIYNASKTTISAYCIGNNNAYVYCEECILSGNTFGNNNAVAYGLHTRITGNFYSNVYSLQKIQGGIFTGRLGYNAADSPVADSVNISLSGSFDCVFLNAKTLNPPTFSGRNTASNKGKARFEHYLQVANDHYIFDVFGDIVKTLADGTGDNPTQRSGGGADVFEVIPLGNCTAANYLEILNVRVWAPAGVSRTYRYCVQSTFASLPTANFKLYGEYLDQGSGGHLATVSSTQNITTRSNQSDWSQYVEVTVTPVQEGWVNLYLRLMGYESGKKVWVDPALSVT